MESLRVAVEGRLVAGEGTDIIGPFTLDGRISDDGRVSLLKDSSAATRSVTRGSMTVREGCGGCGACPASTAGG